MNGTKLTQSFFSVLKNLANQATRGPWRLTTSGDAHWLREVRDSEGSGIAFCSHFSESQAHADARYIAAVSPDVVLAMVARIEALENAADRLLKYRPGTSNYKRAEEDLAAAMKEPDHA